MGEEKIYRVLVANHMLPELDYLGSNLSRGQLVKIPLRNKETVGVVLDEVNSEFDPKKLKSVIKVLDLPPLTDDFLDFIYKVSNYNMFSPTSILKMVITNLDMAEKKYDIAEDARNIHNISLPDFTPSQLEAVEFLRKQVNQHNFNVTLLEGVTGSGKTEVYFAAVKEVLDKDEGQVLIMLPEIVLTNQVISRFQNYFGMVPEIWHSDISKKKKIITWQQIAKGNARLVIGARSALFLPFKDLRLIIIDEEHDASYKQEEGVIYNARDMSILRASKEKFSVILASATPSVESLINASNGKYQKVKLASRFGVSELPNVDIINMLNEKLDNGNWISPTLRQKLAENLSHGKQSLLFLNRRGYAPLTLCRNCGFRHACKNCVTLLVDHKDKKKLICHHCGYSKPYAITCPECKSENSFVALGPGVERIVEEVQEFLPKAKVALLTKDTISTAKKAESMIGEILAGNVDIIVGTQIIAKGHHFPKLTLVGVIDADIIQSEDLRAAERCYQLLYQVSGRAGREGDKGEVILQSYNPQNKVLESLKTGDPDNFINYEIELRKLYGMPPFSKFAAIIIYGKNAGKVEQYARKIVKLAPVTPKVEVLGPVEAVLSKLKGDFRYRVLLKADRNFNMQEYIKHIIQAAEIPAYVRIKIDIDPYNFM